MEKANNRGVIAIGCQSRGGLLEKEKIKKRKKKEFQLMKLITQETTRYENDLEYNYGSAILFSRDSTYST